MSESELKDRVDALRKALQVAVETMEAADAALKKSTTKSPGASAGGKAGEAMVASVKFDPEKVRAAFADQTPKVQAALGQFSKEFDALGSGLAEAQPEKSSRAALGTQAFLPKSAAASAATDSLSTPFAEFITSVGQAVADAQTSLDAASRVYSAGKPLLPTLFRIPKLSAEMRFALNVEQGKKVSLVFFSETQKAAAEHQQAISFDVVSTPPPPELLAAMQRETPVLPLVLDELQRATVFAAVAQAQAKMAPATLAEVEPDRLLGDAAHAQDTRDRALIIAADDPGSTGAATQFLLLAANPAKNASRHAVGIWSVDVAKAQLNAVLQFSSAGADAEEQGPLKKFVNVLAEKQAVLLATLRGT